MTKLETKFEGSTRMIFVWISTQVISNWFALGIKISNLAILFLLQLLATNKMLCWLQIIAADNCSIKGPQNNIIKACQGNKYFAILLSFNLMSFYCVIKQTWSGDAKNMSRHYVMKCENTLSVQKRIWEQKLKRLQSFNEMFHWFSLSSAEVWLRHQRKPRKIENADQDPH